MSLRSARLYRMFGIFLLAASISFAGFQGTDVVLPSVGHGQGSGSSVWRTTLWVHNPGSTPAQCEVRFLIRNQTNPNPDTSYISIAPGETVKFDDGTYTLFGIEGYGAIRFVCDNSVIVNSRIFNQEGSSMSDTQGQFFGGIPVEMALRAGQSTEILGVNQDRDRSFRYNFGFVETAGASVSVQAELLDEDGLSLASSVLQLGPYEPRQLNIGDFAAREFPTGNGRLHIEVLSGDGAVMAFGSGIANQSQDPSSFEMLFPENQQTTDGDVTAVFAGEGLSGGGTSGDLTLSIQNGGVAENMVATGAITSSKIATGAVGATQMATATPPTAGQTLGYNGATLEWMSSSSGGDITSVTAGAGLSGGGSSGDLTLSVPDQGILPSMINLADANPGYVLKYECNEARWSPDSLSLPFSGGASVKSTHPAFKITNSGIEAAIEGRGTGTGGGVWGYSINGPGVGGNCSGLECVGVHGLSTTASGETFGVLGTVSSTTGTGVRGESPYIGVGGSSSGTAGQTYGVLGTVSSTGGTGVRGESPYTGLAGAASGTTGVTYGVWGWANSDDGYGVFGYNNGGHGVYGITYGDWNWRSGVFGKAINDHADGVTGWNTGGGVGVYAWSEDGTALIAKGSGTGNLAEIYDHSVGLRWKVTHDGQVYADGAFHPNGADFAEMMPAYRFDLEPGDVVALTADGRLTRSFEAYQATVVGVVSTRPGYLSDLYRSVPEAEKVPLAVVGIVPVKATAAEWAIRPGDLLTASAIPGTAMRAKRTDAGTIIGKALEGLESGDGLIRMLVMLR